MQDLMENWRGYLAEQEEEAVSTKGINTVGDLKKLVRLIALKKAGGKVGRNAAKALIGAFPGGGTAIAVLDGVTDIGDAVKTIFSKDDKFKSGTGLDNLNVDDNVSKIVDDPIEVAYLNYLVKDKFAKAPDDQSLEDFDVTLGLQQYIARKFDNTTVKK